MSAAPEVAEGRSVEPMRPEDWPAVRRIFEEGIQTGQATFETEAPDREKWEANHLPEPRLVAGVAGEVVGWAALSPVSARPAYAGVAEVSIYVAEHVRGRGIGRALLDRLVDEQERRGLWTLQAVMFPENAASVALHRRCGFPRVGRRQAIGRLHGVWRDTVLMERRSPTIR